jgi:hypothetical protein
MAFAKSVSAVELAPAAPALTARQAAAERGRARKFVASLDRSTLGELGDQLVLGEFDWREWFDTKPSGVFMRAVDDERILREETT